MTDIRVATALVVLYRGCVDLAARERAIELVPELAELVRDVPTALPAVVRVVWPPETGQ